MVSSGPARGVCDAGYRDDADKSFRCAKSYIVGVHYSIRQSNNNQSQPDREEFLSIHSSILFCNFHRILSGDFSFSLEAHPSSKQTMRKSGKKAVQVGLLSRKILSRSLPPIANRVVSPLSSPKPIPLPGGSSHLPMPTTVYPVGVLRTPNSSNSRTTSRKRSRVDIEYERKGEGGSPKRSKSTLSHKDNSELLKKQAPADWEKTLGCIQDMRKG